MFVAISPLVSAQIAAEVRRYAASVGEAKTTEEMIAAARAAGVSVAVTQRPKGGGEIAPLPGLRRPTEEERAADLAEDDDGSGVVQ